MTLVHAIGDIRPGDTGFLWIPACPAAQGICTRDESAVTCRNCLTKAKIESLSFDLVPLVDEFWSLRDDGQDREAEALLDAVALMTGLTYGDVYTLAEAILHRTHGDTIRYVHAPF